MTVDIYVDGSFNEQRQTYGSGIVIILPGGEDKPLCVKQVGSIKELLQHRNITGELFAVLLALDICDTIGTVEEINLYYDYAGIEKWVTGEWQAKKQLSRYYLTHMIPYVQKYKINFNKVRAHTGDKYNSMADKLARDATFIEVKDNGGSDA